MTDAKPIGPQSQRGLLLLAIAYLGFVSLGLPDTVAGVAWPSVRERFTLSQSAFGLVFIALGCGYCASGFFGGKLTHALGLGNLLWISSAFVAVAMLGSGLAPAWPVMVGLAVVWGLGSGGIDAGLNAYVSRHFSARHVNWLHACYSLGATLGPLAMTAMLVWIGSWRLGYALVGGTLLLMALLFLATRSRWSDPVATAEGATRRRLACGTRCAAGWSGCRSCCSFSMWGWNSPSGNGATRCSPSRAACAPTSEEFW